MKWLLVISFFAIKLNEASSQTIKWGNEFTATLNSPTLGQIIPGSINSKVYVIENPVNTNQANTNEKHIVTSLRIFDGATKFVKEIILSDLLAKNAKASPEKIYVGDVVVWGNQLKVFYTVEQDKKSHAIFYVQTLSENGAAIDAPIKMGAVDVTMGVYFGRGSIGMARSMAYMSAQYFKYAISPDSSKFVQLDALLDPKTKKSKFFVHSFDKDFRLLNSKPVEIEVPSVAAILLNLKINDKGDIFLLIKSPKSREEMKEEKNGDPYSYQIHVSVSGSNNGQFRSKTLALAGNRYVTSAEMFIDKDNEVLVTGTYTNSDDKQRGRYHAGYFSGGFSGFTPDIKLKPFPTTDAFFDNLAATQKKDLRTALVMIGKTFYSPIPKKIIPVPGEGHYVIAEVEAVIVVNGYFEQELLIFVKV